MPWRPISRGAASSSIASVTLRSSRSARSCRSRWKACARRATSARRRSVVAKAAGGDIEALKREVGELGDELANGETRLAALAAELDDFLARLPNLLHASVPEGADADANVEVRRWGAPPQFAFQPLDHVALGEKLGAHGLRCGRQTLRCAFRRADGRLARLQRAITQLMLDMHTREHGYSETYVPYLVNDARAVRHGSAAEVRRGPVRRGRRAANCV